MSSTKEYSPYDADHPINVAKRSRPWLTNRLASGKINQAYADTFCIHAIMVGLPRANESRATGTGCNCPLDVLIRESGWPVKNMSYNEWMEKFQT